MKWLEHGDKGSKYFFQMLKYKEARDTIEMIVEGTSIISNQDQILQAFAKYYFVLFTNEVEGNTMEEVRDKTKNLIPKKVNEKNKDRLGKPLSKDKITSAIMHMSNGKAPGPNDIPIKFYKQHIDWI